MQILMTSLLVLLVVLAISVSLIKRLLPAVIIFMSYSIVTSLIWMLLQSPDLAITEAAVGAGITTVLFLAAFKRMCLFERSLSEEKAAQHKEGKESSDEA